MEKPKVKPEHALMEAIGFDEDDLDANREGQLSERQREKLDPYQNFWSRLWLVAQIVSPAVVVYLIFQFTFPDANKFGVFITAVIVGTLLGYSVYFARDKWWKFKNDLDKNRVAAIQGRVKIDLLERRKVIYTLSIGQMRFIIDKQTFLAFKNSDPYVIYYTPYSKILLSAEWLRDEVGMEKPKNSLELE